MRTPDPRDDLRRRILLVVGAVAMPVLASVADRAFGETGDTGDTGAPTACFAWSREDGECPPEEVASKRLSAKPDACETEALGPGAYSDAKCCYEIALDCSAYVLGCGCSHGPPLR